MFLDKILKNEKGESISIFDVICGSTDSKDYIYAIAEARAIDLIADTISKTEILTFEAENGVIKRKKGKTYWRLNIRPNFMENGTIFLKKLALKLLIDKEALIVKQENGSDSKLLYVAESFNKKTSKLNINEFDNIDILTNDGNTIQLTGKYDQNNTIYYSLKSGQLNLANESFKNNTGKLLEVISKKYIRSNVFKWKLKRPGTQLPLKDAKTQKEITYEEYKEKITDGLMSDEDAVVMLAEMFELINLNKDNSQSLSDYKDMIKQICDSVAASYKIPLDIFYGNKTEKSTSNDDFITFAIEPKLELLEDGFNIGIVGEKSFLAGESVMFNRFVMQHREIFDAANGIDKLTSDGFSRNEINEFLKLPIINEKWANAHNLTKNYGIMEGGANEDGK